MRVPPQAPGEPELCARGESTASQDNGPSGTGEGGAEENRDGTYPSGPLLGRLAHKLVWLWRALSTTRRSRRRTCQDEEETEWNTAAGAATLATFASAFSTLLLALLTFGMMCQTKRAADAAISSNSLLQKQMQSRLDIALGSYDGPVVVEGKTLRLNLWIRVVDAAPVVSRKAAYVHRLTLDTRPLVGQVVDTLLSSVRDRPLDYFGAEGVSYEGSIYDTIAVDTAATAYRERKRFIHVCAASISRGGDRVGYVEEVYELDWSAGTDSATLKAEGVLLRGSLDGRRFVKE